MSYVVPETRLRVTPLVIATGPAVVGQGQVLAPNVLTLTGMLNLTARFEIGRVSRVRHDRGDEVTDTGGRIWTVCCAAAGVGWTLPALSVAML